MAELYSQNEPSQCSHCDHICAGLGECIPSFCSSSNLISASFYLLLLIPASLRLIQLIRIEPGVSLKKVMFSLAIGVCLLEATRFFLIQFTNIQQNLPYLDRVMYWQGYSFCFTMYLLVSFFWMSLRQRKGFMREQIVWGKARAITVIVTLLIFASNFLVAAFSAGLVPTNVDLIAIVLCVYTVTLMCIAFSYAFNGLKLYRTLQALPESDPNRQKLTKAVKKYTLFTFISVFVISAVALSYWVFILAGEVNWIACQTWNLAFPLIQVSYAALILWPLRRYKLSGDNSNSGRELSLHTPDRRTASRRNNESGSSRKVTEGGDSEPVPALTRTTTHVTATTEEGGDSATVTSAA